MRIFPDRTKLFLLISVFLALTFPKSPLWAQKSFLGIEDSVLNKFSIEDLVKVKKLLEKERGRVISSQERDRERGVDLSKDFLNQSRAENANQDIILIRVAEYYIDEADKGLDRDVKIYDKAYSQYEKQLAEFEAGRLETEPVAPTFPKRNYDKAISIYDLILNNFPDSDLADDALYNKAFLLKQMGEEEKAKAVYLALIDKFPESQYMPDSYMQLAEFYFQPKLNQGREETIRNLNQAVQLYKNVINYKESPRYDEALYKLGWTYYRLAAVDPKYYDEAIYYFTSVVHDIDKFKSLDPSGKYVKSNIQPEALQYLAASFIDTTYTTNGIGKAVAFITQLGKPQYGVDVLMNMGDLYARLVNYPQSIKAYSNLLGMYPDYERSPLVRKKIADVYLESQQIEKAYAERNSLFDEYNPKSEWYAKLQQKEFPDKITILEEASQLTEEALRSNIVYQLALAQEAEKSKQDSLAAYSEFVGLAAKYLDIFPTNDNAYEINWSLAYVLDTELHRYKDAFEQYIRVSNDYLEETHREDAANNAIVVSQTLVDMKKAAEDTTQITGIDLSQLAAQDLSPEEKLLAEAFDNYIKLFPNQEKTASYLASAGALYYRHRQYNLARKYYKTMVTKFPESQQKSIGLISLMNSYFFLGKYQDAEFVAKKIVANGGVPEDQREVARKRIGESIFKNAERMEQSEDFLNAAKEYYRVYQDAPYYKDIVDVALFNSARNYEKAGEWQQAIRTYDELVNNYTESKYRLVSLGKIADAYKQIEDFKGVGQTYERIYQLYPKSKDAEAALFNAGLFYTKAEEWADAIRVNNAHIQDFPDSPDSKELLFDNAGYYLKLGDLNNANRIYDNFAQRYPNDKKAIEAYYRRGAYYYEQNRPSLAKQEFEKAINKSEEFSRIGRDPNFLYASEAYFKLGEIEYDEFKAIKLTSATSNLSGLLRQKQDKLLSVVTAFTKVIEMGSLKGFEAMYKVAEAYETMADDIANQEIPQNLSPAQQLVERDKVFKASIPAYDRAVKEYKNVVENIPTFAKKLEISLFDTSAAPAEPQLEPDTLLAIRKENLQDSTREVALKWYNRAEEKISLILYTVAERASGFIDAYLRQENPDKGMGYLAWKKVLLEKAVQPAVNVTLNAHLKNINMSSELSLKNKYAIESERKILLVSNLMADENVKLVRRTVNIYEDQVPVLRQLVEGGENAATPEGLRSLEYNDRMMSTIDYMNEFLTAAINQYKNTLYFAKKNDINNDAVLTTQDRLLSSSYQSADLMLKLADEAAQRRDGFNALADSTGSPQYQLGIVYFDDQRSVLSDYARSGLEASYQIAKDLEIDNIWTNLILAKLVEIDPAKYLGDVPKQMVYISSDNTWLVTPEYAMDWVNENFDDSQWQKAMVVDLPIGVSFPGYEGIQSKAVSIWWKIPAQAADSTVPGLLPDTTGLDSVNVSDSLKTPRSLQMEDKETMDQAFGEVSPTNQQVNPAGETTASEPDTMTLYFRKHFNLADRSINGTAYITADDEYHFYLNGEYIKADEGGKFEKVDQVEYIEISDFLKPGENVIAIDATDFDGPPRNGMRFYMELELLPGEITKAAEQIRKNAEESVDPERLKTVIILNKNRVLSQ